MKQEKVEGCGAREGRKTVDLEVVECGARVCSILGWGRQEECGAREGKAWS